MGKTRRDRIRNITIREMAGVVEISRMVQEGRIQCFGHILRRDEEYVGEQNTKFAGRGQEVEGKTKGDVQDRVSWRRLVRNSDPQTRTAAEKEEFGDGFSQNISQNL